MRTIGKSILILALFAAACFAQQWEFGASGGGSLLNRIPVTNSAGSAEAGFEHGGMFSLFVANNPGRRLGGELRYDYIKNDLAIYSGNTKATFAGVAHAVHYDFTVGINPDSRTRIFAIFGGGVKVYTGTGTEQAYMPLSQYAYLTKTRTVQPMASVGVGVKRQIAPRIFLRTEVRDYITPFPTDVITPAPGSSLSGNWLHNIVPMAGVSFEF